ncbi:MAG: polysaccharide biosynthesis protein, partial [Magnetococcales bacterium]|nr:polysaccharide biosynthesis protein [Magnetococcales bacterium]
EILDFLGPFPLEVRILPSVENLASGKVTVDAIRRVQIEDLLGRESVPPVEKLLGADITGKSVVVTGAGGSIGSELARQILSLKPRCLVLYERSEFALYDIEKELRSLDSENSDCIIPLIGSVKDRHRMEKVFRHFQVETVYHAAAYKHVPLVELNPVEGVVNNVFGTLEAAQAAQASGVSTFVLISTDKAVRPTSIMGVSKRLAELCLQALAQEPNGTRFVMVRFGNVLGSSGSVVPLFREQIKQGGPITVTHTEVTRYFMTIREASQLVIQAGAMGKGGDVFVLDMGEPVKIYDLARRMIDLSGLTVREKSQPDGDIEIQVVGLRPGEKLFEELLIGDNVSGTRHPRIMRAQEDLIPWPKLRLILDDLQEACDRFDSIRVRKILKETAPEFRHRSGNQDSLLTAKPPSRKRS